MSHSIPRRSRSRSADFLGYKPALDRIDDYLTRTNPDLERAKIKKAMELLFGPEPTGYIDGMPYWDDSKDEDEPPSQPQDQNSDHAPVAARPQS
jgi:hypothetical protein